MLRIGFFTGFKGSDTLLIWGDESGVLHFQSILAGLSTGAVARVAIHATEGVHVLPGVEVNFELGPSELSVEGRSATLVVVGRCPAEQFAAFAHQIAGLVDPSNNAGHHYLDWPGRADIQVLVSRGEYPEDFGIAT